MDGLTPWEIASLKVAHHRIDKGHKGYLDRADFEVMCEDCHLNLNNQQGDVLFARIDADRDGRISFQELLNYLSAVSFSTVSDARRDPAPSSLSSSSTPGVTISLTDAEAEANVALYACSAAHIRRSYASDLSAIFAGGIIGLLPLIKSKFFIVAGTLFYDPIRLFRDNIVDYTGSLENNNEATRRTVTAYQFIRNPNVPFTTRLRMSLMLCRGVMGVLGWVVFAATLDCLGGVIMFLTYSRVRSRLATNDDVASLLAGRRYLLEGCAGLVGGAAGGFAERPLRYVAHHRILSPAKLIQPFFISDAFKGCTWAVYRQAVSHAVFFTAFAYSHDLQRWLWYTRLGRERTSWSDACITAISGCSAGGSYRLVSLPMLNIYHATGGHERTWRKNLQHLRTFEFIAQHKQHGGRAKTATAALRGAYKGLGYSMLWIMPITGAAFLVYERLLVTL